MAATTRSWAWRELRRPGGLLGAAVGLLLALPLAAAASCNAHEVSHAVVGTAVGWDVERIEPCLPGAGSVVYASSSGGVAERVESLAGGLGGAALLAATYAVVFRRGGRPRVNAGWWLAGLVTVAWAGPQLVVAAVETWVGAGEDYTDVIDRSPVPFAAAVAASVALLVALYVRRWPPGRRGPVDRP